LPVGVTAAAADTTVTAASAVAYLRLQPTLQPVLAVSARHAHSRLP